MRKVLIQVQYIAEIDDSGIEELEDLISDIDIPENEQCKYKENSMECLFDNWIE